MELIKILIMADGLPTLWGKINKYDRSIAKLQRLYSVRAVERYMRND